MNRKGQQHVEDLYAALKTAEIPQEIAEILETIAILTNCYKTVKDDCNTLPGTKLFMARCHLLDNLVYLAKELQNAFDEC